MGEWESGGAVSDVSCACVVTQIRQTEWRPETPAEQILSWSKTMSKRQIGEKREESQKVFCKFPPAADTAAGAAAGVGSGSGGPLIEMEAPLKAFQAGRRFS